MNDPTNFPRELSHNIEFVMSEHESATNLQGCTLLTGFYGIGKIGFIVVNHMVQKLGAKRIGCIVTEYMPPFISVKGDKLILPFEIYRAGDLVFLAAFFEPYKYEHRPFAKALVKWSKEQGIGSMVLVGGLDSRLRTEEEVLAKAVFTSSYKSMNIQVNIPILDEGLYVTGPLALLLLYCEVFEYPSIGILPYAERSRPDPIGAAHAVEIINDLLNLNCGVEELVQEAENIEKEISAMMDATENPSNEDSSVDGDRGLFL
jgi:uncharacterized protein